MDNDYHYHTMRPTLAHWLAIQYLSSNTVIQSYVENQFPQALAVKIEAEAALSEENRAV